MKQWIKFREATISTREKKMNNEDNVCLFYLLLKQMHTKFVLIDVLFHVQCTVLHCTCIKKKQRSEDIIAPWNKMKYTAKTENIYTIVWL